MSTFTDSRSAGDTYHLARWTAGGEPPEVCVYLLYSYIPEVLLALFTILLACCVVVSLKSNIDSEIGLGQANYEKDGCICI